MKAKLITQPIENIIAEQGFCYIAVTGKRSLSSHLHPSAAQVLEDGVPLAGPANALHADIRTLGQGRYSFWHAHVYFSSSDNSDPRHNGRHYAIQHSGSRVRLGGQTRRSRIKQQFIPSDLLWSVLYWLAFQWVYHSIPRKSRATPTTPEGSSPISSRSQAPQ
jgi:hypothetical protein